MSCLAKMDLTSPHILEARPNVPGIQTTCVTHANSRTELEGIVILRILKYIGGRCGKDHHHHDQKSLEKNFRVVTIWRSPLRNAVVGFDINLLDTPPIQV